jgi:hypothetical protein
MSPCRVLNVPEMNQNTGTSYSAAAQDLMKSKPSGITTKEIDSSDKDARHTLLVRP